MKHHRFSQLEAWKLHAGGGVALAALSFMTYFFGVRPVLISEAEQRREQQAMQSMERELSNLKQQEQAHRRELRVFQEALESESLTLQKASFRNERLARLTELAEQNALIVDGIQTRDLQHREQYDLVPVQIEGMGGFAQCARFLHELSEQFQDTGIDSFELRGNPGSPSDEAFFVFEMTWYAAPSLALANEESGP